MNANGGDKKAGSLGIGAKIGIVVVLLAVVGIAIHAKNKAAVNVATTAAAEPKTEIPATAPESTPKAALPRLLDIGADRCIPCKMMAPILADLKKEFAGKMDVEFIDVWKNKAAGEPYGYRLIPTQIFFDASGKELFRHEGFISKEDILAKWKELGVDLGGAGKPGISQLEATPKEAVTIDKTYPNLVSGALSCATLGDLPEGQILKSGSLTLSQKDIDSQIRAASEQDRAALKRNQLFVLDQIATRDLLAQLARGKNPQGKDEPTTATEMDAIQGYLKTLVTGVNATDTEVSKFYEENKDMCGGAPLEQVKGMLKEYVIQQKQQQIVNEHIRTIGQRLPIEVSAAWAREQVALATDNPVDKARKSGLPSMVDFGASGCRPCEMMTPILADLKKKFAGKLNVEFIHVREEQILAARYGIESIPVQVFFDKNGKEVFRHTGFFAQPEIEKKLAGMGVK